MLLYKKLLLMTFGTTLVRPVKKPTFTLPSNPEHTKLTSVTFAPLSKMSECFPYVYFVYDRENNLGTPPNTCTHNELFINLTGIFFKILARSVFKM